MANRTSNADEGHRQWPWFVVAALILVAAGGGYWWLSQPQKQTETASGPQAPLVRATDVQATDAVVLRQTGFVQASDAVDVVPQMIERIVEIGPSFAVGTIVSEGDLLVRLDATGAEANRRSAQARLSQAEAALAEARVSLDRQTELARENVVSQAALDNAQVAYARAEADTAVAEAEVARAALASDDAELRAPFDAIVTEERASIGQLVQAGASIGRLVAINAVEIEMGLLPADLALLEEASDAVGLSVMISDPDTGQELREGEVVAIVPALNAETRTIGLLVRVRNPFIGNAPPLRIGALVDLALPVPLDGRAALQVAAEALKGGDTLWSVTDGQLSPHSVTVLSREGDMVNVRAEGLAAGDPVLLSDLAAPAEGDAVRVAEDTVQIAEGQ